MDVINEPRLDPEVTEPEAIGVGVKDGVVTLTGHVPSYAKKLAVPGLPNGSTVSRPWPTT
jgi:hypothetical protein